jgi:hypothetical protein
VVDIAQCEFVLGCKEVFGSEKGGRVVAPVTEWVFMMRDVVDVV